MRRLRSLTRTYASAFACLFALALLMRMLVPAGWMPSSEAGRWVSICTEGGAQTAFLSVDGTLKKQAPSDHGDPHCTFAGLGLAFDLPAATPVIAAIAPIATAPLAAVRTVVPGRGLAAPPPPKTGPPLLN